ncbi:hypothetical protein LVD13_11885 [Flavobacteriaceae bacterium D16]|nr:hypothetical protein [Flavobacteriaceae bacterium D16]
MNKRLSSKRRLIFTGLVTLLVLAHLLWDYNHGGVPTHYLLHRDDLPGISNWWGIITLPLVTFLLLLWINKNLEQRAKLDSTELAKALVYPFFIALIFGVLLSVFFILDTPIPGYMMLGAIAFSFFHPLYRPEYLLGFILGMSYTFGANLPILFSLIFLILFLFNYKVIRFGVLFLISRINKKK